MPIMGYCFFYKLLGPLLCFIYLFIYYYYFYYYCCCCYCSVYPSVLKMEIYLLILSIDFRDYTFSNILLFNAVHSHNVQELLFSSYIKFSIPFLSYIIHFFSSLVDTSCISYRWNSKDTSNSTRWDEGRNELLSWDNLERCTKILKTCWHSFEEHWDKWTRSLQCPSHSILFLDGWGSRWYLSFHPRNYWMWTLFPAISWWLKKLQFWWWLSSCIYYIHERKGGITMYVIY